MYVSKAKDAECDMAGLNLDVKSTGEVRNCYFDDADMSGSGGSSLTISGVLAESVFEASGVAATINTVDYPSDRRICHDRLHVKSVTVTNGILNGCHIQAQRIVLSGDETSVDSCDLYLSPQTGANEGILLSGDVAAITDTLIRIESAASASNTFNAVSVSGDACLLTGLRFGMPSTRTWKYLIEVQAGATDTTIGVYSADPSVYGTGKVSDSGTTTWQVS